MFKIKEVRKRLNEITGYDLRGDAYVLQAFTRSSYIGGENNEIFEMYGDSALNYFVMQLVHDEFGSFRTEDSVLFKGENGYALKGIYKEAQLDALKKKLVCNEMLAAQIDKWNLAKYLQMGKSDEINRVGEQTKTKADLFEAILGAYAVSYKFDNGILKSIVARMLPAKEILAEVKDMVPAPKDITVENAITKLKEMAEQGICSEPEYSFQGPEDLSCYLNGEPRWSCKCMVESMGFCTVIFSNSKKTAKKCTAYQALCKHFDITNDIAKYKCTGDRRIVERDGSYFVEDMK